MKRPLPRELNLLLEGTTPRADDRAWTEFVGQYSRLIIRAARSVTPDHDSTMDAYGFALEELRKDDYRRLRSFEAEGAGHFTTWLVIVVRRLCLDHQRKRYGRVRNPTKNPSEELKTRRRLVDLLAGEIDLASIPDPGSDSPEVGLRRKELKAALETALQELSSADQLLLRRRFEDSMSVKELTDLMRLPTVFHVYRRLNTLCRDLRTRLEAVGIDGPIP
jgi:RNA polymerase sigma factor (sigma-70 family)